jgi:hypothetical protein
VELDGAIMPEDAVPLVNDGLSHNVVVHLKHAPA